MREAGRKSIAIALWFSALSPASLALCDEKPSGNNPEALGFAGAMTQLAKSTWPKGDVVWHLELAPSSIKGDIEEYRGSVTYCKARVVVSNEWYAETPSSQRSFVKSMLDSLHKAPVFTSGKLDYYPNSSGEMAIVVVGRVVATGRYTRTTTTVSIQPGTSKPDPFHRNYSAKVFVVEEAGRPRFRVATDLPEGTSVLFTIERGSYSAQDKAVVTKGGCVSALFGYNGGPFPKGVYALQLNVFTPETGLMIQASGKVDLFQTKAVQLTFTKTKF